MIFHLSSLQLQGGLNLSKELSGIRAFWDQFDIKVGKPAVLEMDEIRPIVNDWLQFIGRIIDVVLHILLLFATISLVLLVAHFLICLKETICSAVFCKFDLLFYVLFDPAEQPQHTRRAM